MNVTVQGAGCATPVTTHARRDGALDPMSRKGGGRSADAGKWSVPAPRREVVLACRGLRHAHDQRVVLDDVWFSLRAGDAYGLASDDPMALTTIARMVCGLVPSAADSVVIAGRPVQGPGGEPLRGLVGYVAQRAVAAPSMTVADNVRLWARLLGLQGAVGRERTSESLALAGIADRGGEAVRHCTTDVLRQMSLAVALLCRPRLLVLDEPFRGVNPQGRERLLNSLAGLRAGGTAVLHVDRDVAAVQLSCDTVGRLDKGRLVALARAERLQFAA